MRKLLILCSFFAFVSGCQDAVGPGGDCSREMSLVLATEGAPTSRIDPSPVGGNFTEIWNYPDKSLAYTFKWGASYTGCEYGPTTLEAARLSNLGFDPQDL